MGSSWETAYEAFVGFLEAKTEVAFEKLMDGVQGEIVNGWTVLRNGEGGSVLHWVHVGVNGNRAIAADEVTATDDGQELEVEEEEADNANGSETGSMKDFIDDASTSADSECRTQQSEEVGASNAATIVDGVVEDNAEINRNSSLMEEDTEGSVLSSMSDDAFQIGEQNRESEEDDEVPLRHTRARTIVSKKDVPPPPTTRNVVAAPAADESDDDMPLSRKRARRDTTQKKGITKTARQAASASAAALEDEYVEEDDMPRRPKRARRMPPTKKVVAKSARQAAITAVSENEDQDNDDNDSDSESEDVDVSDYEDAMPLGRKQARRVPPPKKAAAQTFRQAAKNAALNDKEMDYDDYDDKLSSHKRARRLVPPKKVAVQKQKQKKKHGSGRAVKKDDSKGKVSARSKRASKRQAAKISGE